MVDTTFIIEGMTCDHCAMSITEEVEELDGVTAVSIDRPAGLMVVSAGDEVTPDLVTAAVAEAGNYTATAQA